MTRLSVGTVPIGGLFEPVTDEDAAMTLETAWDSGVRTFDTAPVYGLGLAERRLGTFLSSRARQETVISTKVGRLLLAPSADSSGLELDLRSVSLFRGAPDLVPAFDFSADGIQRSLEESMMRLSLERVDIVHLHDPDNHYARALDEAFPRLDQLRSAGVIGAIGAGMVQTDMLTRFATNADFDCFLVAGRYTLLDQSALDELLPLCAQRGIAVLAGGVYNSGILASPYTGGTYEYAKAPPTIVDRARSMAEVTGRFGVPLKAAAIQFPLGHPAVASVVIGVRSKEEMAENVAMFRTPIPPALWDEFKDRGLLNPRVPVPKADSLTAERALRAPAAPRHP